MRMRCGCWAFVFTDQVENNSTTSRRRSGGVAEERTGGGDGATLAFLTVLSSLLSRSFPFTIPCVAALLPSAPGPD